MLRAEEAMGTMTVWLAVGGTALIATVLLTLSLLETRFNPVGTLIVAALIVNYVGLRFFASRHLTERSAASLLGLTLSILGQLCIVALTITSVGLLLLPAALMSLGLLVVALLNQSPLGRTSIKLD